MSTKTTFKRIALVTVAALGFGMLSVVPSQAVTSNAPTSITVGTVATCRVNVSCSTPVTLNLPAGWTISGADSFTVVARVISAPNGSNSVGQAASGSISAITSTAATSSTLTWAKPSTGSGANGTLGTEIYNATGTGTSWTAANSYTLGSTPANDLVGQVTLNLKFAADYAGAYTILVAAVPADTASISAAAALSTATLAGYVSSSFAVTTSAAPATVTLTNVGGTAATSATGSSGALLKISGAVLSGAESITLTGSTTTVSFNDSVLTAGDFTNGVAYVNVSNSAEQTATVTASQSGTLTGLTSTSVAITWVAPSTKAAPTIAAVSTDTGYITGTRTLGSAADVEYDASPARTSQKFEVTLATAATADFVTFVNFTDVSGKATGQTTLAWSKPVTIAKGDTSATISVSATLLDEQRLMATLYTTDTAADTMGVNGETAVGGSVTLYPATGTSSITDIRAADKSATTIRALVKDQYAGVMAGESVTVTVTGRNAAAASTLITDATGYVSFTVTDAGTSGTTDSVLFTGPNSKTKTLTITYGTTTVTTMTLTGGNTTAGVTSSTKTAKDIAAGASGATAGAVTITATLKDASGALMAGVPVTWTVAGTGVAITSTTATSYSGSLGTATTSVYAWIAGTYTVTATSGGKTATAEITFAQNSASEARTLSASVSGQLITAKLVDRFGNPVLGATVYASKKTGTGYFGGGVSKTSGTTGADGTVDFAVAGGDLEVLLSTVSYSAAAGTKPSDQTCARAGAVDCNDDAADDTAFTAYTAGTATTAEKGVGASFAPAGVSSVTVSVTGDSTAQTAADAAAEATDAANAATDAANAAAEAADAATAAAQDAADAVAALSAQVAALISGLKSQLTALTNLVIKIQKKVKA